MKKLLIVCLLLITVLTACGAGDQVASGPVVTINKPPT